MKKIMGLFLLAIGLVLVSNSAQAASPARGAKGAFSLTYTTTVSTITAGPGVVYGIILSSGAASEFVSFFDLSTAGATVAGNLTGLKVRVLFSSTTANTVVAFDPPVQFSKGIYVGDSANTGQSMIIWEPGHVPNGY